MDIGGTFTDIIVYDEATGSYQSGKVPTTPTDVAEGVLAGVNDMVPAIKGISFTVHGTTVGLNAFLQRRGERVLLLATAGVSDTYLIARGARSRLYDLHYRKATPLVPPQDIVSVHGRLDFRGEELEPLAIDDIETAARAAVDAGIHSIAVAFLFSYVNPAHELEAERVIKEIYPAASISLSHRVAREWREYERTSSTVLDAYIAPTVERYLDRLEDSLQRDGLTAPLHVMQSNGGVLTAASARRRPVQTLFSGPAGGTMGGVELADALGRPDLICVDMGGTSFDVSLIVGGSPDISQETKLGGLPLLMPIINIHTIGAGGGSLAYSEAGGLRVGPESAGAAPGPACYGRGGSRPTVTDANLVVGRIDPERFLGGRMRLDVEAAEASLESLAGELDVSPLQLAEGILDVVNAKMAQAIRTITVEQGIEPRDFTLVAFGGAGPMHALFLAQQLDIKEVIIPPHPGAFSAWGMLQTKLRHDFSRAYYTKLDDADPRQLHDALSELASEGSTALAGEGVSAAATDVTFVVEVRYVGQEYTVSLPLTLKELESESFRTQLANRFDQAHELRYGHANQGAPVEFVVLRATAQGALVRNEESKSGATETRPPSPYLNRTVVFDGVEHNTAFYVRESLPPGFEVDGPAVIEEQTATTIIPPGCVARVDDSGSLIIAL